MVQHILLEMVARPLFDFTADCDVHEGATQVDPEAIGAAASKVRDDTLTDASFTHPLFVWLALAGTLWFWHAAGPYQLALENPLVHFVEHMMFLTAAVLFWSAVLRPHPRFGPRQGFRVMMTFTMAFQAVPLPAFITFAPDPWYPVYAVSARAWGLEPSPTSSWPGC